MDSVTRRLSALIVACLLAAAVPALAHHALSSEFLVTNVPQHWTGTLRSVEWTNPHSHLVLDIVGDGGKVTTWTFTTASPNGLRRVGFRRTGFFELGKTYSIIGFAARDGSPNGFVQQLTLPDGRTVRIWFGDPNGSN